MIVDSRQKPVQDARIAVISENPGLEKILPVDKDGIFHACGLHPGWYSLRVEARGFKPHDLPRLILEPSQSLFIKVTLSPLEEEKSSTSEVLRVDYTSSLHQTIIEKTQLQDLPSAHNVWSVIENQDLSATTNRIDVGGLWGTIPALFSSRGSCSWTQNIYLLNGLEVTDPYWGGMPLFYPDFHALRFTQLINAGHPVSALTPGAYFNLITERGTDRYQGGISAFFIDDKLQSTNISPHLRNEGLFDSHAFNFQRESHFHLSGPVASRKITFFTSWSASSLSRHIAEFEEEDKALMTSGLLSFDFDLSRSTLRLLWTGQRILHPSLGAKRNVPFSATWDSRDVFHVVQAIWEAGSGDGHSLRAGLCLATGKSRPDFQDRQGQHGVEILRNIPQGPAPWATSTERRSLNFSLSGESFLSGFPGAWHRVQYGFMIQHGFSSTRRDILDNLHLRFFEGEPLEIAVFNTPVWHKESTVRISLFGQDSLTLFNFISFYFGFHLDFSHGWLPPQEPNTVFVPANVPGGNESKITWLHLSPRLGIILPLSRARASALKLSLARYHFMLPLHLLTYGNRSAWGALVYDWNDLNADHTFQPGEAGTLIRREGPFFSGIDTELKRPRCDEFTISFHHAFGSGWYFSLAGFYRETRNLMETVNTGVPFSSYQEVEFYDIGDDRIPGSHDDLFFIVWNQDTATLGEDFYLLTNPDAGSRISRYHGLDLTLVKKYGKRFGFFLSLTAVSAVGTTSPGNTEWENDDGVIGQLYDNPNTLINARGRMRFDRGYTGRIGMNYLAPLGIRIGLVVKYYDGQPFARKIIVTGMNQGPFTIQAHPRGVSRYEYNRTVDIRLEKRLSFGKTLLRVILDGFNVFNRNLATEENEWTGPEYPLRYATEIQSPRVFRLGMSWEF